VFLDHAVKAGMTGAIVHVSKIATAPSDPAGRGPDMEDLIYDRRREGYDPLHALLAISPTARLRLPKSALGRKRSRSG